MSLQSIKDKILENPKVKKEYEKSKLTHEIARLVMKARIEKGITQTELADLAGTKQPAIARIESGYCNIRIRTLNKIAEALEVKFTIKFV